MKIGVFDSGLGGLFTLRAIVKKLPEYDYVYLGDTQRLPYGSRSPETIYQFLQEGIDFLLSKGCALVIVACNTASAEALRKLQNEYLPKKYPNRKVLGVIVPMTEACDGYKNVGLVATEATIASNAYPKEFKKRLKNIKISGIATPLLVPIIEGGDFSNAKAVLTKYLSNFAKIKDGKKVWSIDALLLGCTHYGIIKKHFRELLPKSIDIISQENVVPLKVRNYLMRHTEIEKVLTKNGRHYFYVTDLTSAFKTRANKWFGKKIVIKKITLV
ncbi:MAG: glutamate racemase [Candidatus Pacebacteria bacterium]|nr:glutamate racemase [Candidatus Paceibacterota bacterium]